MDLNEFIDAAIDLQRELKALSEEDPDVLRLLMQMTELLERIKTGKLIPGTMDARGESAWQSSLWRPEFPLFEKQEDPKYARLFNAAKRLSSIQTYGSSASASRAAERWRS